MELTGLKELSLEKEINQFTILFDQWIEEYFSTQTHLKNYVDVLFKSQKYSLKSGGKRFRPFLAATVFRLWNSDLHQIKNFCLALEMVHTYSLIHDDLPCMDNDDVRRGQPTNHKVFGEDIALLAGDALLTEAFQLISVDEFLSADTKIKLVSLLSKRIGSFGMIGGQVLDMQASSTISFEQLETIHYLKTAYLIQTAAEGAAVAAGANQEQVKNISKFAEQLGLAFQIKDDLLDLNDNEQDFKSYATVLGQVKTIEQLEQKSNSSKNYLKSIQVNLPMSKILEQLVDYNLNRTK